MNTIKIHILDDEPELLALMSEVVTLNGLNACSYTLASELFANIAAIGNDDILVLDLQMPEMDGIEVMRKFAESHIAPRLILISGQDIGVLHSAEKLAQAHGLDIIGSLSKPISIETFSHLLLEQISPPAKKQVQPFNQRLTITELREAISNNQLVLHYQPQYNISSGVLSGAEALIRWQHPQRGLIFPNDFIPFAEQQGIINEFTHWVINECVRQAQIWQELNLPIVISVNISADDVTRLTLPEQLSELLSTTQLDPSRLVLELTESALMGELVTSLDILTRLRLKGIKLSIDDFGTGYSSLSLLHRVPFTELKIDKEFVSAIDEDDEARAIVKTCIMLAHELRMTVLAEGIEKASHLELLRELGCDHGQGYFFSRPVPIEQFNVILKENFADEYT